MENKLEVCKGHTEQILIRRIEKELKRIIKKKKKNIK